MTQGTNIVTACLKNLRVHTMRHTRWNRQFVTGVSIGDQTYDVSPAFWPSLLRCFHIAPTAAEFMGPKALLRLLQEAAPERTLRYVVERDVTGGLRVVDVYDPHFVRRRGLRRLPESRDTYMVVN